MHAIDDRSRARPIRVGVCRARPLRVFLALAGISGSLSKGPSGKNSSRCTAFPRVLDAGPPHSGTNTAINVFRALGCCKGDWVHFKANIDDHIFDAAREGNTTALFRAARDKRCLADDPWSSGLARELGPSGFRGWDGFVMQTLRPTSLHWAAARYVWMKHNGWGNITGKAQTSKLIRRVLADPQTRASIVHDMAYYDTRVGNLRRALRGDARYFEIVWMCGDGVAEVARAMRLDVRIDPTRVLNIHDIEKEGTVGGLTSARNSADDLGHAVSAALRDHFASEWLEPTDGTWYDKPTKHYGPPPGPGRTKPVPPREPPPPQCRAVVAAWLANATGKSLP